MKITEVPTYQATIYIGFEIGAGREEPDASLADVISVCRRYAAEASNQGCRLAISASHAYFVYSDGTYEEPGAMVQVTRSPRHGSTEQDIRVHAQTLAVVLLKELRQDRVLVVTPNRTYCFEHRETQEQAP